MMLCASLASCVVSLVFNSLMKLIQEKKKKKDMCNANITLAYDLEITWVIDLSPK
jgi:hypothetical protein